MADAESDPNHAKNARDKLEAMTKRREFMAAAIIDPLQVGGRELSIPAPIARFMRTGKPFVPFATQSKPSLSDSI